MLHRTPRVRARLGTPFHTVAFVDETTIVAAGADSIIYEVSTNNRETSKLQGHTGMVERIHVHADGRSLLSLGYDGARTWRLGRREPVRIFAEHEGAVVDASYLGSGQQVVSIGNDSRLLMWSQDGNDVIELFKSPIPLVTLEVLQHNNHIVVVDNAGSIWDIAPTGGRRQIRTGSGALLRLRASRDGTLIATGSPEGVVTVYNSLDWSVLTTTTVGGSMAALQFDPQNRELLVGSEDGNVRVVSLGARRVLPWRDISLDVRDIVYSPDGEIIGVVCNNGQLWFYHTHRNEWVYTRDHESDARRGAFSPSSRLFVSLDFRGVVIVRDILATFEHL